MESADPSPPHTPRAPSSLSSSGRIPGRSSNSAATPSSKRQAASGKRPLSLKRALQRRGADSTPIILL
jgi:hypothetical protein